MGSVIPECSEGSHYQISKSIPMFSKYRGRSHTKKQQNCKPKISVAERRARIKGKAFAKLFPGLVLSAIKSNQSIYQHSITRKRIAV